MAKKEKRDYYYAEFVDYDPPGQLVCWRTTGVLWGKSGYVQLDFTIPQLQNGARRVLAGSLSASPEEAVKRWRQRQSAVVHAAVNRVDYERGKLVGYMENGHYTVIDIPSVRDRMAAQAREKKERGDAKTRAK